MMEFLSPQVLYLLSLSAGGLFIIWIINRSLSRLEKLRLRKLRHTDFSEVIDTETPEDHSETIAQNRGVRSIQEQFNLFRRLALLLVVIVIVIVAVIPFLSTIPTIYVSLVVGGFTVIFGVAAKPFIENLIGGIVVTMARPLKIGDIVTIDGQYGIIEKIDLLYTVIKIWNWRRFVIPNSILLGKEFTNHSLYDTYDWTKIKFYVAPGSDLKEVEKLAVEAVRESRHLSRVESPAFWVMDLGKDAIECWVAGWANSPAESWSLATDARTGLNQKLLKAGVLPHMYYLKK